MAEGHRERLKAKILAVGIENISPKEILEFLLYPFYPRIDTVPMALELLDIFGNLDNVLNTSAGELERTGKLCQSAAIYLSSMRSAVNRATYDGLVKTGTFDNPDFAKKYFKLRLSNLAHEEMNFIMLDIHYGFLRCESIAVGGVSDAEIDIRLLVQRVIATGAKKVIMAHNHPGKSTKPSDSDLKTTRDVFAILRGLDVELLDHIIIAGPEVHSMWTEGEMNFFLCPENLSRPLPEMLKTYRVKFNN